MTTELSELDKKNKKSELFFQLEKNPIFTRVCEIKKAVSIDSLFGLIEYL
jgi:hypothetical protein